MLNIWLYWENLAGATRPAYLDLCLETIRRHAPAAPIVVDYETAFDYVKLDRDRWDALRRPNFRSDYLRARLLHAHGGLWIDIDTIAVAPLEQLLSPLRMEHEVVAFGREVGRVYPGIMAAAAGADSLERWMRRQDEVLETGISDYGGIGQILASEVCSDVGMWPLRRVAPVMWWEWRRFTTFTESPAWTLRSQPTTVCLWNKTMGPLLRNVTAGRLLSGQKLLSRLLRIGLGLSTPADEHNALSALWPVTRCRFTRTGLALESRLRRQHGKHLSVFSD